MGGGVGEVFATAARRWKLLTQPGGSGRDGLYRPQIDLAVLSRASMMLAHCPSSFSNVATRMRKFKGQSTSYWGLPHTVPNTQGVQWREVTVW